MTKVRIKKTGEIHDVYSVPTAEWIYSPEEVEFLPEEEEKEETLPAIGNVYTNDINYWQVVKHGTGLIGRPLECLRPVVMVDGKPSYYVGYYQGNVRSIKPYAKYIGNFPLIEESTAPHTEPQKQTRTIEDILNVHKVYSESLERDLLLYLEKNYWGREAQRTEPLKKIEPIHVNYGRIDEGLYSKMNEVIDEVNKIIERLNK